MRGSLPDVAIVLVMVGTVFVAGLYWLARHTMIGRGLIVATLAGMSAFYMRASAFAYGDGLMAATMLGVGFFLGAVALLCFVELFLPRRRP